MKKQIIKVRFSDEDKARRARKFAREIIGIVPPPKVESPKKGGGYKRREKHRKAYSSTE